MKIIARFVWILALGALVAGCTGHRIASGPPPPLLLISLDAFRWDYCDRHPAETPTLRRLAREGISAAGLIPVYPSNTFPNHYSIVTGLYPSHHGIINNQFFDPGLGEYFHYNRAASVRDPRWWGGEPIWVTAIRQGLKSATSFWVGSETAVKGVRPTYWRNFDGALPFEVRLAELVGWLQKPSNERPQVITFYLEEANSSGHHFGPDSKELVATLGMLDGRVGQILKAFHSAGVEPNVVVVSDHGMTPISTERVVLLDDFINSENVQVDFDGPVAGLRPRDGDAVALRQKLERIPHAKAYLSADLPKHFHIDQSPRNPSVWVVPEEGWELYFRSHFEALRAKFDKGDHGFDPSFSSMRGILIAQGPSFKSTGQVVPAVENIHLYNALCAALQLRPAPNDGDERLVRALLR
jgi:predicted AlkP superfamily pyrophosphatase or phosphodiesterase